MKSEKKILAGLIAISISSLCVLGQGFIYTFQGHTTSQSGSTALINESALYPNQPFNFSISVNPSQPGTYTDTNFVSQSIHSLSDPAYPGLYESAFLASFQNGNRLWNAMFATNDLVNFGYGGATTPVDIFAPDPFDPETLVSVTNAPWGLLLMGATAADGSLNSWNFKVSRTAGTLSDANPLNWQVGQSLAVVNTAVLNGNLSRVLGTVTLVDISPVPEPSMIVISYLSVICFVFFQSLNKKKNV